METPTPAVPSPARSVLVMRVLTFLVVAVLLVIAFFLGRSTAPGTDSTKAADPAASLSGVKGFVTATGLVPGQDFSPSQTKPEAQGALAEFAKLSAIPSRIKGSTDAPVVMTMIEDFSCPMCTKFQKETLPKLQPLIDQGKLRLQWHTMVIFPEQGSDKAARGAIAAAEQNLLWQFVSTAFGSAADGEHPHYDDGAIMVLAQKAKVPDLSQFKTDYESVSTAQTVERESKQARELGVSGTPFFIIGDSVISGAYPTEYFENTVKYQLYLKEHPEK